MTFYDFHVSCVFLQQNTISRIQWFPKHQRFFVGLLICLFICLIFYAHPEIACSYQDVTIAGEGLTEVVLCPEPLEFSEGDLYRVVSAVTHGPGGYGLIRRYSYKNRQNHHLI